METPMKQFFAPLLLLSLAACSTPPGQTVNADLGGGTGPMDTAIDVASDDRMAPDVAPETDVETDQWLFDTGPDTPFVECAPGDGCFLAPCASNAQCQSGWCVEHMGDGVCTRLCTEECPPGWNCKPVGSGGPDLTYVCVSSHANLCRPCSSGADCKGIGGTEDLCLDYGDEGSFCGGACVVNDDCPWGFSCVDATTVDGIEARQCLADAGVCPCTAKSVSLSLFTPCQVDNEFGTCTGKRFCSAAGLSPCDAPTPEAELCNGLDEDCDGSVDEANDIEGKSVPLCDDDNPCTEDACLGEEGCTHTPLTEGECLDGDACTIGDHCEAGICMGAPIACDDGNPCTDDLCDGLGGCEFLANTASCDDGDPCTVADGCQATLCVGFAVACDCQTTADCLELDDGNPCTGTLVCAKDDLPYTCQLDPSTVVHCDPPEGPDAFCLTAICDPASGQCKIMPDHDGLACDDGDACTVGETCQEGLCDGGVPANCNDGNLCTDDSCDPATGCDHVPNTAPCQDGNACTLGDACANGTCLPGKSPNCNDNNPCTDDDCDPTSGCTHVANSAGCSDGDECSSGDHCENGTCISTGNVNCDDKNPCTDDLCTPAGGCAHINNGAPCSDQNACTVNDECVSGLCKPGASLACNDGNPCTDDSCDQALGCLYAANTQACDDGNACTLNDTCKGGACKSVIALDCDDDNVCTTDTCTPAQGCVHALNTAPCDDGNPCTTKDQCQLGECIGSHPLNCNDNNPCTDDACDDETGCSFVPNQIVCDDGDACTTGDTCGDGWCKGATLLCNDGNLCTDDHCDPESGCQYLVNQVPCDDGDACTMNDVCTQGQCTGPVPVVCNDNNVCTDDSCAPETGCLHLPIEPCCGNGTLEAGEDCDGDDATACPGVCQNDCTCGWITIHNTVAFTPTGTSGGCSYNNSHAVKWLNLGSKNWKDCALEASRRGAMMHSSDYTVAGGWYSHRKGNNAMTGIWSSYQQATLSSSKTCILGRDPHAGQNNAPLNSTVEYDGWVWRYQDYGNKYYDECQTLAGNAGAMIITPYTIGKSGDGYWINSVHMCNTYEWITSSGGNFGVNNYGVAQRSSSQKCMVGYVEKIQQ
jgi:hypothetical protein